MERGDRLLAAALLQGSLDWARLRQALGTAECPADSPTAFLQHLVAEGVLSGAELAALESRFPGSGSGQDLEEEGREGIPDGLLGALEVTRWRQYRNLRFIGEGGMGRIFQAYDSRLHRMVALKFLRRRDPALVARFRQEAQLHGRLEHPHICRVYEVVEWEGQACIAMQFIRGESLEVAAPGLMLREKVALMADVADAVHAAHRQGLIHRDLKPANIMVEQSEGQPLRAMVLDFGLARIMEEPGLTQSGAVVGTYHYMAPEQAAADGSNLDRRTDVYGIGATLYAILSGHPPFWDSEGAACAVQVVQKDPVPLRQVVLDLPEDLETVVTTCLQKVPERRYATAREVAEELRRVLDDAPVQARRPSRLHRLRRNLSRHKTGVLLAGAALVMMGLSAAFGMVSWYQARERAGHAQLYGQQAERLEAMGRYLALLPTHDIREERQRIRARMEALETQMHADGSLATGPAAYALGRGCLVLQEPERALAWFERALASGFRPPAVRHAMGLAQIELYRRAARRAETYADAELSRLELRHAEQVWKRPALANLQRGGEAFPGTTELAEAVVAFHEGRPAKALELARRARASSPWLYESLCLEGEILLAQARTTRDRASSLLEEALEVFRKARAIAPSDPAVRLWEARAWSARMRARAAQGYDATEEIRQALEAARSARELDPSSAPTRMAEAEVLLFSLRHDRRLRRASDITVESLLRSVREAESLEPSHGDVQLLEMRIHIEDAHLRLHRFEDPRPALARVRALARLMQDRGGVQLQAMQLAVQACGIQMTYESHQGGFPYPVFEEGLGLTLSLLKRHPDYAGGWQLAGSLWLERAEYERQQGEDPGASCTAALRCWQEAERLDPDNVSAQRGRASTQLVAAEHALDHGGDPEPLLEPCLATFARLLERLPLDEAAQYERAESLLFLARRRFEQGAETRAPIHEALRLLGPASGSASDDAARDLLRVRLKLQALRTGLDPSPRIPSQLLRSLDVCIRRNPGLGALRSYRLARAEVLALLAGSHGAEPMRREASRLLDTLAPDHAEVRRVRGLLAR